MQLAEPMNSLEGDLCLKQISRIDIEKLNKAPFDWCFNCAKECCSGSIKMFAYIVISIVRAQSKKQYWFLDWTTNSFSFTINLKSFLENEAIRPYLLKKKYWKHWLNELVRSHILLNADNLDENVAKALKKPKIAIFNDWIELTYNYN